MILLNLLPYRRWALARARRRVVLELLGSAGLAVLLMALALPMAPGALVVPAPVSSGPASVLGSSSSPADSLALAVAAYLLQELARLTPPDVGLREVHWEGGAVALRGMAGSAHAISAYMALLERESMLVHHVRWGELQGSGSHASEPGALDFLLTAQLRQQAVSAHGGPRP